MSEPVKGFEHRANPSYWRVEWFDAGSCEAAVFSGPTARQRAIAYAMQNVVRGMPILSPAEIIR